MKSWTMLAAMLTVGCGGSATEAPPATAPVVHSAPKSEAPKAPKKDSEKTVVDVAIGSPDHTTLVTAVKAAGLVNALSSPGGIYTIFAPTDAAFAALPAGTVEGLLAPEKQATLKAILMHHAIVPIFNVADLKDGQVLTMADGTDVTVHVSGGEVKIGDAKILGSVSAVNGVVHVVDHVILPPSK